MNSLNTSSAAFSDLVLLGAVCDAARILALALATVRLLSALSRAVGSAIATLASASSLGLTDGSADFADVADAVGVPAGLDDLGGGVDVLEHEDDVRLLEGHGELLLGHGERLVEHDVHKVLQRGIWWEWVGFLGEMDHRACRTTDGSEARSRFTY